MFAAMVDAAGNVVYNNTFATYGRMNADVETQNFVSLQETYHNAVRGPMGDTVVDLARAAPMKYFCFHSATINIFDIFAMLN